VRIYKYVLEFTYGSFFCSMLYSTIDVAVVQIVEVMSHNF